MLTFGVGSVAVKMMQWIDRTAGLDAAFVVLAGVSLMIVATILVLIRVSKPEIEKLGVPEPQPNIAEDLVCPT